MLLETTKSQLGNTLKTGTKLLVFHAVWCPPCKMLKGELEQLDKLDLLPIFRVDIDVDKQFATDHGVQSIPTGFVYKDGQIVDKFQGFQTVDQLKSLVEKYL
ncbi:thioredoxin family protein [Mycoplasma phocimorsus]|uniref:thioredoxin family protein n=1 Tax=Mycoplasma phocimorsus TaxID=3045839 RepID=UPI0024C017E5|nr:thioredoxin family protein [Mycoplasma phocimorsus]MDJ1649136.1 thioredoxin family protein [Mycoplasma phocimorsus]